MKNERLEKLYELATESHALIQRDFKEMNPLVGVNQKMRKMGVPADVMTIDCLKSGRRIILILHDQQPDILSYQFSFKEQEPSGTFETIPFETLSAETLYDWMKSYFQVAASKSARH